MIAQVVIVDRFGKKVVNKMISPVDLGRAASKYSDMHPECWVTVTSKETEDTYALMPKNMKRDEDRIDSGDMTFDDYHEYWYPVKSNKIHNALMSELTKAEEELLSEMEDTDIEQYEA